MGSLHDGHLSIIKKALIKNDIVIVSIYVNPKQFNDSKDLKKYPRNLEHDLEKLKIFNKVIVYAPSDKDVYNEGEEVKTVRSIDKQFWSSIDCLNVDGKSVREFVPRIFNYSKVGSAQRFCKKYE